MIIFTKLEAFANLAFLSMFSSSSSASTDKLRFKSNDCGPSTRRWFPEDSAAQAETDRCLAASELEVRPRFREKERWCFGCFGVSPLVLLELNKTDRRCHDKTSVIRFGEYLQLWQKFKSFGKFWGIYSYLAKFWISFGNFLNYLAYFHFINGQILNKFSHLVTLN